MLRNPEKQTGITRFKITLVLASLFVASLASATELLSIKPVELNFGKVFQGKAATLNLRLKTSGALGAAIKVTVPSPFQVDRTSFAMDKMAFDDLSVTVPSTVPVGDYSGKIALRVTPIGFQTDKYESIEVPVRANVVPLIPDFSATAAIDSCKNQGKFLDCSISMVLTTTGPAPAAIRTIVSQSADGKDETAVLDRTLEYQPARGTPFVFDVSKLPAKTRQIALKILIDPGNQVAEGNEANNTVNIILDIPKTAGH